MLRDNKRKALLTKLILRPDQCGYCSSRQTIIDTHLEIDAYNDMTTLSIISG
jgi:hypothetical protein